MDYIVPSAGFFLWLRLKFIRDSKIFVKKCLENLILVAPGDAFYEQDDKVTSSIRLSFSAIDEDQIDHVSINIFYIPLVAIFNFNNILQIIHRDLIVKTINIKKIFFEKSTQYYKKK